MNPQRKSELLTETYKIFRCNSLQFAAFRKKGKP